MLNYAVCEIGGKLYKLMSNQEMMIDFQGDKEQEIEAKVLLLAEDGKLKLGKPYLKEKITLKVLGSLKGKKIRVAKFHAKANYRRLKGARAKLTKVILPVKKTS